MTKLTIGSADDIRSAISPACHHTPKTKLRHRKHAHLVYADTKATEHTTILQTISTESEYSIKPVVHSRRRMC